MCELQVGHIVPEGLGHDNFYGYQHRWIYDVSVTWMEKTVASPFWTGMSLFSVGYAPGKQKDGQGVGNTLLKHKGRHLLGDTMYLAKARVAFRANLFSAPFDWHILGEQLREAEKNEEYIVLPHTGEVLASIVRIHLSSGLVCMNKHLKHITVRRPVVVQLIRMFRDAGHPDYQHVDVEQVQKRANKLAHTDEASIPLGLTELVGEDRSSEEENLEVDKAATPAERIRTVSSLVESLDRIRPSILVSQRDSDGNKEIEASRVSAFSRFSMLKLQTGSNLIDQFQGSYIPRVFNLTLPWCVGGPDLEGRDRFRRHHLDAPVLSLPAFTRMMPRRAEAQIRWDWDLVPSIWSLHLATQVNRGASLSIRRALVAGADEKCRDREIGELAASIYEHMWNG